MKKYLIVFAVMVSVAFNAHCEEVEQSLSYEYIDSLYQKITMLEELNKSYGLSAAGHCERDKVIDDMYSFFVNNGFVSYGRSYYISYRIKEKAYEDKKSDIQYIKTYEELEEEYIDKLKKELGDKYAYASTYKLLEGWSEIDKRAVAMECYHRYVKNTKWECIVRVEHKHKIIP